MIYKLEIKDNQKAAISYLPDLDNFQNGKKYVFTPGVNIIVGENGCGKTTLMNLLKRYLLVDCTECSRGMYNNNLNCLYKSLEKGFLDGVAVYADYDKNTFRLSHAGEKEKHQAIETAQDFATMFEQKTASTGEGVVIAINSLFSYMFGGKASLKFDYAQFGKDNRPEYAKYIKKHRMAGDKWTVMMDEPDRNLSLENLQHIKEMLSYEHPQVQLITVIHNPLLIYSLSHQEHINIIEMTDGYVEKVKQQVNELIK